MLRHRELCVPVAVDPEVTSTDRDAAPGLKTAGLDMQLVEDTAVFTEIVPVPALSPASASASAPVPVSDTAPAPTAAKKVHLCAFSCCGQAASLTCGGCGLVRYCSRDHQTGHWKQHKKVCKATDDLSVRCREVARFLMEEPVDKWEAELERLIESGQAMCEPLVALGVCETLVARMSEARQADGLRILMNVIGRLSSVVDGAKRLCVAGTFDLLEELFRAHLTDELAMVAACAVVFNCMRAADCAKRFMSNGLVEGVVGAVRSHPASLKAALFGTMAILLLAQADLPSVHTTMRNAGAVKVLKAAARAFPDEWSIVDCVVKALSILQETTVPDPAPATTIGHLCASSCCGQAASLTCGGCGLVRYCSRDHQTGHWKQQHKKVCKATDDVSVRSREVARFMIEESIDSWEKGLLSLIEPEPAMCESLVALGVCETLVARMSEARQADGLRILMNLIFSLSSVVDGSKRLCVAGTFDLLEELFRQHLLDELAMTAGCTVVFNLVHFAESAKRFVSADLVEGVVGAVRAHPASRQTTSFGTMVISMLAHADLPSVHITLLNAGAVEVLKAAARAFPDDRTTVDCVAKGLSLLQHTTVSSPAPAPATTIGYLCASSCCGQAASLTCGGCGLVRYCSREHQTGHWKQQHKKVCKATDDVSVRCREVARLLAVEPIENWQPRLSRLMNGTAELPMCVSLVALGVCETLIVRTSEPRQAADQRQVLVLLGRLSIVDDGAKRLVVGSTFEIIEEVLRTHLTDSEAMFFVCSVVFNLFSADVTSERFMSADVVGGVVAAMRAHLALEDHMTHGAATIVALVQSDRPHILAKLKAAGAVEVMTAAALAFPEDTHMKDRLQMVLAHPSFQP